MYILTLVCFGLLTYLVSEKYHAEKKLPKEMVETLRVEIMGMKYCYQGLKTVIGIYVSKSITSYLISCLYLQSIYVFAIAYQVR